MLSGRLVRLPLFLCVLVAVASWAILGGADDKPPADRSKAEKAMSDGNWKVAYDAYRALTLDANADPLKAGPDLVQALQAIRNLGTWDEYDALIEKAVAAHPKNWRLLHTAADSYFQSGQPYGFIVAGKFSRGQSRGGAARWVYTYDRDRVRALQLMQQALQQISPDAPAAEAAEFHHQFAQALVSFYGQDMAWRLQDLTDLSVLPDYQDGSTGYGFEGGKGAPVKPDGSPVYHALPASWESAKSDGERWRWCLARTVALDPTRLSQVQFEFACFQRNQFDVQTLAQQGWGFGWPEEEDAAKDPMLSAFAVSTLGENETIARLAGGVKRFVLPDEFNFIKILQEIAARQPDTGYAESALTTLAQIFEDRRQYPRAAEFWKQCVDRFPGNQNYPQRLQQILGNWGQFDSVATQPAGRGATVDFRFRNGAAVDFEAHEIDVPRLLADLKAYLKSDPRELDWNKMNIENVGWRIVEQNQKEYLKEGPAATWHLDLTPRPKHFDRRITVTTPLQKAGAYLLVSKMAGGNVSRIVLWVADTVIVKKPLNNQSWYYVADAVTGKPIAKANLEFFGYRQRWIQERNQQNNRYVIDTQNFAEFTDGDGQTVVPVKDANNEFAWLITATGGGRLAFLGFTNIWAGNYYDAEYNQVKSFGITDRPVYRPGHTVKFKFWVGHAKYDQTGASDYAGQNLAVEIHNPKGEKVYAKSLSADKYGGVHDELPLPKDAALGVYSIVLTNVGGQSSFRVEEYKKPEYEVTVEAPKEPVMLGEKITATIRAKYLFGAPVAEGKVKYKILRSRHDAAWYPWGLWDWYYGPGYWWYACDYRWYPGWRDWGCERPIPWWWWEWNPPTPPELVAEVEGKIGADGTVKVEIDTALAKALHGDDDHRYEITAEVTDPSRRVIVGQGAVLVARKPFKVYAWVDRGHYRVGDRIQAAFQAQTLDGKPVAGKGALRLLSIKYDKDGNPVETEVQKWALDADDRGAAEQKIDAARAGQYRLSYTVTDAAAHAIEGGYVFTVAGEGFGDGADFRFNDLELVTDKREYQPGDTVNLQVNVNRVDGTVLLFARPANGIYLPPTILRLAGKSIDGTVKITLKDMPNIFLEAVTVSDGHVFSETREIVVPPASRVINVEARPSAERYKPGEKAKVKLKLTDANGEPFQGSTVVSIYDKAVEYISGGSNVPGIREFFWKWRRSHRIHDENSLQRWGGVTLKSGEIAMGFLGVFGNRVDDATLESDHAESADDERSGGVRKKDQGGAVRGRELKEESKAASAAPAPGRSDEGVAKTIAGGGGEWGGMPAAGALVEPTVRTNFADTALWVAALETNAKGEAEVELTMPESLTTWKTRVWAMGAGTRVGEATAEVVTAKNVIVRLQAPRFFVQKDEVVLSANVHNYLKTKKTATASLKLEGGCLESLSPIEQTVEIDPDGQKRVDWRVKVVREGEATVTMAALTDEESDAMKMSFPVFVHGMLKTDSFSAVVRPNKESALVAFRVPAERRPEQSRLEVRYSPTLAGAMVDALPYLASYPYGCTEQTLSRFLPTVMTQRVLLKMGVNLAQIRDKRTNLNAQEIGDDKARARDWQRMRDAQGRFVDEDKNPVFDEAVVRDMVKEGVNRLTSMQCSDGGWGWFSGWGEHSWAHTTAYVVHGLQIAADNDVALVPGVLDRGVQWLRNYQAEQVARLKRPDAPDGKRSADELDAFTYMVLVDAKQDHKEMREFLYRDRNHLAVYAKAMLALAVHELGDTEKLNMLMQNIDQFLVQDEENQTAWLRLPENNWWWCWYGSEYEAQAYYLKLLSAVDPKGDKASRLVKYLVNNRRHATYWNSTRDTAVCVEALADYVTASHEDAPDMTVEILLDGQKVKEVAINKENLFSFDNKLVLEGKALTDGEHKLEIRRKGKGPVYSNAYLTNFTLEDPIAKAGLEIKVDRKYYKLEREEKSTAVEGSQGQVVDQKVEKYKRIELADGATLKSGDLVEVELEIDSKNDYEYIVFEDMKAAGFEPVEVRSGYNGNDMGAYVEFHDERVAFFARTLARGKHSVAYRLRAEIPGRFSALPTRASAMYAPELKANSNETKVGVED